MAREAEQQKQDEALLQACPAASLVHIPLWGSSLSPETPGQLQGSLAVPASCSVRLLRRIFARAVQVGTSLPLSLVACLSVYSSYCRAVTCLPTLAFCLRFAAESNLNLLQIQVQPSCVQLIMPQGGIALQDFTEGQEASIKQYGLDSSAGQQGLQVQMQLQEGSAKVHALVQQEVDLVKQELLSARLRSPASLNPTGSLLLLLPDLESLLQRQSCSINNGHVCKLPLVFCWLQSTRCAARV